MEARAAILVAACGNADASGDAFGSLVARRLAAAGMADVEGMTDVEVIDLAMNPNDLLDCLEGRRALVVVDAAVVEGSPVGRLLDLDYRADARAALLCERATSTHGLGLAGQLAMAEAFGWLPAQTRLMVATIDDASLGGEISAEIASAVSQAALAIQKWVARWQRDFCVAGKGV